MNRGKRGNEEDGTVARFGSHISSGARAKIYVHRSESFYQEPERKNRAMFYFSLRGKRRAHVFRSVSLTQRG